MKNDSKSLTLGSGCEDSPTTVETPWTDADALAFVPDYDALTFVPDDVRSNIKHLADILDADADADAETLRQLVPKLAHDYLTLAETLDECEERDALHYELWRKADTALLLYRFNRHTAQIANGTDAIADALDLLRDMFDSLDGDGRVDPDALDQLDEIELRVGEILNTLHHLASLPIE